MKIDDKKLYYLAGIIDGEGTIGIRRQDSYTGRYIYSHHIAIKNSDVRLIHWLVDNFGGTFPKPHTEKDNYKDTYNWQLSSSSSYKLLKKVGCYLLLKREQADLAIELYEKVSSRFGKTKPLFGWRKELAEELYQECKYLNKVGRKEEVILSILDNNLVRRTVTLEEFV